MLLCQLVLVIFARRRVDLSTLLFLNTFQNNSCIYPIFTRLPFSRLPSSVFRKPHSRTSPALAALHLPTLPGLFFAVTSSLAVCPHL